MANKKLIATVTVVFILVAAVWAAAAGRLIDQRGVLSGKVMANGLKSPGSTVSEGDIMVYVETVTGSAVAARATTNGTVKEVLVKPGDMVKTGDVLLRLEAGAK